MKNDGNMIWQNPRTLNLVESNQMGEATSNQLKAQPAPDDHTEQMRGRIDEGYLQSMLAALGPPPINDNVNASLAIVKRQSLDSTPIWDSADLDAAVDEVADRLADRHSKDSNGTGRHRRPEEGVACRVIKMHGLADLSPDLSPGGRAIIEQCIGVEDSDSFESCQSVPARRPDSK
jgi:hypothetical protein